MTIPSQRVQHRSQGRNAKPLGPRMPKKAIDAIAVLICRGANLQDAMNELLVCSWHVLLHLLLV